VRYLRVTRSAGFLAFFTRSLKNGRSLANPLLGHVGTAGNRLVADLTHALFHVILSQHDEHRFGQPFDDVRRRAHRGKEKMFGGERDIGKAKLGECRHVGKGRHRSLVVSAIPFMAPPCTCGSAPGNAVDRTSTVPVINACVAGPPPL